MGVVAYHSLRSGLCSLCTGAAKRAVAVAVAVAVARAQAFCQRCDVPSSVATPLGSIPPDADLTAHAMDLAVRSRLWLRSGGR